MMKMNKITDAIISLLAFMVVWYGIVVLYNIPPFLLPSPLIVQSSIVDNFSGLMRDAGITMTEILLGFIIGTVLGMLNGLLLQLFKPIRRWVMPLLVMSQSIPIYAIAPLLVLWFGYDMAPKIAMAVIIIFFPVTTSFYDGLRFTDTGYLDLADSMRARKFQILYRVRIPASLPSLGSGLRVAASIAPIGAIVGEWVGASAGLGYRMLYAHARMQTADMFAALIILIIMALILYYTVDVIVKKIMPWQIHKK